MNDKESILNAKLNPKPKHKQKQKRDPVVDYSHKVFEDLPVNEIPYQYQKKVLNYLINQKSEAIKAEDFLSAQKFEDKINEIKLMQVEDAYESRQNDKYEDLIQRLSDAQSALEEQRENLNQILQSFQDEREEAIMKLDEKLDNDLYQFDEDHNIEVPPKFRKFSPEYLNIRKREKFMVSSKRYVEANNLKKEADAMEKKERAIQEKNWENYVNQQRQLLIKKQQEQRRCFIEKWDREWTALVPSAEAEVTRCENVVKNIEANLADLSNTDQLVAIDGTALTASQTAALAKTQTRTATVTTARSIKMTSSRNSKNKNSLPPLTNVSPTQADPLRSRLAYMRATNYKISRQKQIKSQKAKESKRAKSNAY